MPQHSSDKRREFAPMFGFSTPSFQDRTASLAFDDAPLHTDVRKLIVAALTISLRPFPWKWSATFRMSARQTGAAAGPAGALSQNFFVLKVLTSWAIESQSRRRRSAGSRFRQART
jgi:hypothetical protein